MNEKKFETVSSVVDSDQQDDAIIENLLNDDDSSAAWQRYHLMGDVMRGETANVIDLDLSAKITAAIADEPTILAPQSSKTLTEKVKAKVLHFAKPLGQMAIAASAAGLMIMGVQQNGADTSTVLPENQVVKTMPFIGVAEPVSLNFQQHTPANEKQAFLEQQRRFHALLSDHKQQVKLSSVDLAKPVEQQKVEKPAK